MWHTQGSGKSISMVCFAGKLMQQPEMQNPTLVVVTDRNDLDGQFFQTFVGARSLLQGDAAAGGRPRPVARAAGRPAVGRHHLHDRSRSSRPERTRTRFPSSRTGPTSSSSPTRRTARNTAFGRAGQEDRASIKYGFAKHLRDALPNATFVGFTGTPVETDDKDTRAVFGDYVSIYDIQDAVDDGATVPIYYESRLAKLDINQAEIEQLNEQVEEVFEDEEDVALREAAKTDWAALEKLVGAEPRIKKSPRTS